jgi:Zn-dependent hydrolases, including glyoxylases
MLLQRFEVPGLSQYSYVLASGKEAIVIDPRRDVDIYMDYAFEKDLKIRYILETHIHADFASGSTELAAKTGAQLWLSAYDEDQDYTYTFHHHAFRDGDEIAVGDLRLVAMHTPGHTPEHLSFLLYEKNRCGQPLALFSGDFIFVGSLGRPDLLGEEAKQQLAGELFDSVHNKIKALPDGTMVMPGHGAGSLCGAGMAERPETTIGYERHCNVFMTTVKKDQFIHDVLSTVPQFPPYYRRMKKMNSAGFPVLEDLPGQEPLSASDLNEALQNPEALVLDLRSPAAFGGAHIPGSFNIGLGPNLSLWSGWVLPYDQPIYLVGDAQTDLDEARRSLIRVGHDQIAGYLKGGIDRWIAAGLPQAHVQQISVTDLDAAAKQRAFVLDVRSPKEWQSGHIEGATHIPGGDIPEHLNEVPKDREIHVICGSGYRSSIVCSILERSGIEKLRNTVGGMTAWNAQKLPVAR